MKKQLLLFTCMLSLAGGMAQEGVVISEIFYDPPFNGQTATGIPHAEGEYIELYNVTSGDIDLTGWTLDVRRKTETYVFPAGTLLKSFSTCVVTFRHPDSGFELEELFPQVTVRGDNLLLYQHDISLSDEGETITLRNTKGWLIDRLQYDGTEPADCPGCLRAVNADGLAGSQCQSVTRTKVTLNVCDYAKADRSDFVAAQANPMETAITIYKESGLLYTYDKAGNRIGRTPKNIVLSRSNIKSGHLTGGEAENAESPFQEQIKDYRITIYPNPTKGRLAVEISPVDDKTDGIITLASMQGVLLYRYPVRSSLTELDLEVEPSGVYLMLIEIDGQKSSWVVIKE